MKHLKQYEAYINSKGELEDFTELSYKQDKLEVECPICTRKSMQNIEIPLDYERGIDTYQEMFKCPYCGSKFESDLRISYD